MPKLIAVNERGCRIGQDHHRARLSDDQVDEIRELYEYDPDTWSTRRLAKRFGVTRSLIYRIVTYRVRAQHPVRFKRLK